MKCAFLSLGAALLVAVGAVADETPAPAASAQETLTPDEEADFDRFYVGLSGSLVLPQGGAPHLRRLGGAALRGGCYLTENWAFEAEAAWLEDAAGLSAGFLGHLHTLEVYDRFFGYSQFDPFVTVGARGWIGRNIGQVGPKVGVGAFYHLTDSWSLRGEADATLGLDTRVEVDWQISAGVQYSF